MHFEEPISFGTDFDRRRAPLPRIAAGAGVMCTKVFFSTPLMHPSSDTDKGAIADHFDTMHCARHFSIASSAFSLESIGSSGQSLMHNPRCLSLGSAISRKIAMPMLMSIESSLSCNTLHSVGSVDCTSTSRVAPHVAEGTAIPPGEV